MPKGISRADSAAPLTREVKLVLAALLVGGFAAILDSTMVSIALHTLVLDLHSSVGTLQWVSTDYLLALAIAIPITGWAERRFGGRRTWIAALVFFVAGSVLCAVAWNDASLITFRVVQGFGGGLIFPLMQTLAVRAAGGKATSRLIATITLPMALGPILGPVIGGVILHWLSWQWLFLVNVPVIAVGLVLALRLLPNDRANSGVRVGRLDVPGLALLAPALVGVLLGLSQLATAGGLDHPQVIVPLIVGIVLLGAFTVRGLYRGDRQTLIDIRLLKFRSLGSASAVLFVAGASLYAAMFLLPLYFQQLRSASVLEAGLLLIPQGVGSLLARFAMVRLVARFGPRTTAVGAFIIAAVTTLPFALADSQVSIVVLEAALFLRGAAVGALLIPPMSVAYSDVPRDQIPDATMTTRISQQIGASFGTAVVAVVLQNELMSGSTTAFHAAFWWTIAIALIALVPAMLLPRLHHRTAEHDQRPSAVPSQLGR